MNPLITIIVPVYNIKDYVRACFDSLKNQTYKNLEILIIDDGSTDGSEKLCDDFGEEDKRVKVFHTKNGGLSAARNFGLKKMKGDFVAFVDGDDSIEVEYIEKLASNFKDDTDIVVCGYFEFFSQKQKDIIAPKSQTLSGEKATIQLLIKQENLDIVAWNKLYRKKLFTENNILYPNGDIFEDTLTTYKLYSHSKNINYINYPLYNYRHRKNSITAKMKNIQSLEAKKRAAQESKKYFQKKPQLLQVAKIAELLSNLAFIDAAIVGKIDKKFFTPSREWILKHSSEIKNNSYLSSKLLLYILLIKPLNGSFYKIFRKIKH